MKALITGASSGIGYEMALYLSSLGYDLVLVSRDAKKLQEMQEKLKTEVKIIAADLSIESKVKEVYVVCKNDKIDFVINNAGFGDFGEFDNTDLTKEIDMINLNIKAVHILTKMFLKDMKKNNFGHILNVASAAAFAPGPLMATYYSTKAYVFSLTTAIQEELRRNNSKVVVSCLCPGPVKTNFNKVANVDFTIDALEASDVAKYAIDQCLKGKEIIIPGFKMKCAKFFGRFASEKYKANVVYNNQQKKIK